MDSSTIVKLAAVCNEFDEAVDNSCAASYKIPDQDVIFFIMKIYMMKV